MGSYSHYFDVKIKWNEKAKFFYDILYFFEEFCTKVALSHSIMIKLSMTKKNVPIVNGERKNSKFKKYFFLF